MKYYVINFDIAMAYNAIFLIDKYLNKMDKKTRFKDLLIGESVSTSVVGDFHFDDHGALRMTNYLGQYQNGKIVPIDNDNISR